MKRNRNKLDALFDFATLFVALYIAGAILLASI